MGSMTFWHSWSLLCWCICLFLLIYRSDKAGGGGGAKDGKGKPLTLDHTGSMSSSNCYAARLTLVFQMFAFPRRKTGQGKKAKEWKGFQGRSRQNDQRRWWKGHQGMNRAKEMKSILFASSLVCHSFFHASSLEPCDKVPSTIKEYTHEYSEMELGGWWNVTCFEASLFGLFTRLGQVYFWARSQSIALACGLDPKTVDPVKYTVNML